MPIYHFALHNDVGGYEAFGYLTMADDDAARAFGCSIIRDIMSEHTPAYAGSVVEITENKRVVGRIAFDFEEAERQPKYG